MKYNFLLFIVVLLASCSKEPSEPEGLMFSGDTRITELINVSDDEPLIIAPGSILRFAPKMRIHAYGSVVIEGTAEEPITLISEDTINDHWILETFAPSGEFVLSHVNIVNGLLIARNSDSRFTNVNFYNDKDLEWNSAATRFWGGTIFIEDCTLDWNRKGEGFLVHDIDAPIVRNSTFKKVNDAVEYLGCVDGEISGCMFLANSDDAIDLNACDNILLTNNEFYEVQDRGMEIGDEGLGKSTNIKVINNLFVDCKIGVNVKENSDIIIENITAVRCKIAIEVINEEDNGLISHADAQSSVIVGCNWPLVTDASILDIRDCMSDVDLASGGSNMLVTNIEFADSTQNDYKIVSTSFPSGKNQGSIGYQKR